MMQSKSLTNKKTPRLFYKEFKQLTTYHNSLLHKDITASEVQVYVNELECNVSTVFNNITNEFLKSICPVILDSCLLAI